MGGGKTVSVLTALEHLSCVEDVYPALVLAPLRVAKTTWPDEVAKWAHTADLRIAPVTGNLKQRLTALSTPADIYTINYEQLPWLVEHYGDSWPFKTVIADEQTRLKSYRTRQGSKRAKALARVAHTKVTRFIGLTGTPSPNGLADLWGQTWFLDRGERLGRTYSAFEARWFTKGYDGFSVEPLPSAQKEIEGRLRDLCLTVTGLPVDEPITNNIYVDMPTPARFLYDDMERELFMEIGEHGVEAANAAVKTMKLLQLANGAAYIDDKQNWRGIHDEKIDALRSIVEEGSGAPILVAYHFKSDHARLCATFPKARTLDANPATIREWNEGRIPLLFAHPACLHPETEVLTENRGWVRIVDVKREERVFDGVEFVTHGGCSFSGVRPVIERLGITLTPNHKLLLGRRWVEAKDVRDHPDTAKEARYSYGGADPYLGAMLPMRRRGGAEGLCQLPVQEEPQAPVSPVYDLVDCGPRHRFLVRNAKGDVFVSHNSAGHGLNLARGGNILAFFSLNWSLENYMQIIERIGPMRQKQEGLDRPVFVHHIMARNTVDDMVLERLRSKRDVQEVLLEAMKRRKK
jgi:hypothetical protein